jgi:hypothetical protein
MNSQHSAIENELNQAKQDIHDEKNNPSSWISDHVSSIAFLMSKKRQDRMAKQKTFNGITLEQDSPGDTSFSKYVNLLKERVHEIPPGTRIQIAVFTSYVDPEFEPDMVDPDYYPSHWTPVDILVGENGKVSSFVVDAAGSVGYTRMNTELAEAFPDGNHYVYQPG